MAADEMDPSVGTFNRRTVLAGGSVTVGATTLASGQATRDTTQPRRAVNVMDFGAKADGISDDTAAFNRATRASEPWQAELQYVVNIPAGIYRVDGPVCVRKGQTLKGVGYATQIDARKSNGHTFVLGNQLDRIGKRSPDPGGAPVAISDLRSIGGAARGAFVFTDAQGFSIKNLFLSAVGTGLHIAGADGLISDILVDQALNGIIFDGCQNIIVNSVEFYSANYATTFLSNTRDVVIGNTLFCYSAYSAMLFGEKSENIHNVLLANSSFVMNAQPDTFAGFVHVRSTATDAKFTGCTFRNWSEFAIAHGAGNIVQLSFDSCTFDASRTTTLYNGSANSKVIQTSLGGEYDFNSCRFVNLRGPLAKIGPGLRHLRVRGGTFSSALPMRIECASPPIGPISIADVDNFISVDVASGAAAIVLPWWGTHTIWKLSLLVESSAAPVTPVEVLVSTAIAGGVQTCRAAIWKSLNADHLAFVASFGERPDGPASRAAGPLSGMMCMSVRSTNGKILSVETAARTFV